MNVNIKIAGPAGAGVKSTGMMVAKALSRSGLFVFEYSEYPSLIRGGHNTEQIFAATDPVFSQTKPVDILFAMDKNSIGLHLAELHPDSLIIFDSQISAPSSKEGKFNWIDIPMLKIARDNGSEIMANNVGLGAIAGLVGLNQELVNNIVREQFSGKKPEVATANIKSLMTGYDFTSSKETPLRRLLKGVSLKKQLLMTGSEAIGCGAIAAGLGFYAAYPMTPSSPILHFLAEHQDDYGFVVRQPEDEIAAVNMVIGAMHMGVRSMCGTSGGGFSLMNESLALAGMTETPLVVVLAQRPGPATGLPTWTEQGELQYAIHAAHGEFPRFVLAPGDTTEAFQLTVDAFNLAERYQTPVIILTDKYLGESAMTTTTLPVNNVSIDRGEIIDSKSANKLTNFQRYAITASGVSARTLPGTAGGVFCANSDEHEYHGLVDESSDMRIWQNEKRNKKATEAANQLPGPVYIGPPEAKIVLITWGSSKLPALQAMAAVNREQKTENNEQEIENNIGLLHFTYLWPLNKVAIQKELDKLGNKISVMIEGNSTGQFESLLKEHFNFIPTTRLRKYDGRPVYPEEILSAVSQFV